MTVLKTLHDTDHSEPTRLKYDGDLVYAGFAVHTTAGSDEPTRRVAELDCVGSYEIHEGDHTAFVELDELERAVELVASVPYIDAVETPFGDGGGE